MAVTRVISCCYAQVDLEINNKAMMDNNVKNLIEKIMANLNEIDVGSAAELQHVDQTFWEVTKPFPIIL